MQTKLLMKFLIHLFQDSKAIKKHQWEEVNLFFIQLNDVLQIS